MKRPFPLALALILFGSACGEMPTHPTPGPESVISADAAVRFVGPRRSLVGEPEAMDLLAARNSASTINRVDTATAESTAVGSLGFGFSASAMATSAAPVRVKGGVTYPAGTHFGVMESGAAEWVVVVDTETGKGTKVVQVVGGIPGRGIAFGPDGATLYLITDAGKLFVINLLTGEQVFVKNTVKSTALEWDPDGGSFVATHNYYLWRVYPEVGRPDEQLYKIATLRAPCTLARSPGGRWYTFVAGRLYEVWLDKGGVRYVGYNALNSGVCGTAFAPRHVVNDPPTAGVGGPYAGPVDIPMPFEGTGSDPEGGDLAYAWDFGDGTTEDGTMPSGGTSTVLKSYSAPGTYTVTFTVTDDAGISRTVETTATIDAAPPLNLDPQVVLNDDVVTSHGQLLQTDLLVIDPDGVVWTYVLNWGDGSPPVTGTITPDVHLPLEHQYPDELETWTISVVVDDGMGGVGEGAQTVTFTNDPPDAELGFHPYIEGENVCTYLEGGQACIHGGGSSDPDVLDDVSTLTFFFDYGGVCDGDPPFGTWTQLGVEGQPPCVYPDNGTYGVTLTVSDTWASDTDSKPVTIENVAPRVGIRPGGTVEMGTDFQLGAGFSDPGRLDAPWTWTIDWGDGTTSSGSTGEQGKGTIQAPHRYLALGTYEVTVCVTDKDGGIGCNTTAVEVIDTIPPVVTFLGNNGTYDIADDVAIECTAEDSGSGVASDTCKDFVGPAWSFGLGETSYTATATDFAGNVGSGSVTFAVTVSYDGLCTLVRRFVDHHGIANSLCVKLNASAKAKRVGSHNGPLEAFINEVEAQSGKEILPEHAGVLIAMAKALMW